ncbi:ABC-2 type transport system ATP-binding protein [Fonticella tunisiensis]|uniref:ABC-2 type transport system ATP-binding protein n=2 Tax=Fonticella tunisiensis TaxID=1096341 RepID=A0A4R7KTZ3_9CLOT|nr:ABC-2 type transport system ATP-binding protein [Fonticella tunisiensis]
MITITNLSKNYGKNKVLQDVNINIPENKISFLMGENGAGKTTFIKCLVQLENYKGQILFDEKEFQDVRDEVLAIYDDAPLYTNLSGIENLDLMNFRKLKKKECYNIALKYLSGDILKRKVSTYSYGQRKKLFIALVEICSPKYLIMDEISNGLDYESMKGLKKSLKEWSKNMTIILTGHQFDFYNNLIDELYIVKDSQITYFENLDLNKENLGDIYDENII